MGKRKIWVVLIVTLILAYFAPAEEGGVQVSEAKVLRSSARDIEVENSNLNSNAFERVEVLNSREPNLLELGELGVFSARKDVMMDVSHTKHQIKKAASGLVQPTQQVITEVKMQAPQLPFKFLGTYIENDRQVVFLQHENQNMALQVGEIVLEKYRLEAIEANILTFTYLPMEIKQTLALPNHEKL